MARARLRRPSRPKPTTCPRKPGDEENGEPSQLATALSAWRQGLRHQDHRPLGPVVGVVRRRQGRVDDHCPRQDPAIAAREISIIGHATQGVRIMSLDDDDLLVAVKCVPPEDDEEEANAE